MGCVQPDQNRGDSSGLASVGRARTRERTSDRVYEELVSAIRDLRIPPGASLSETDLADRLHVSRTPLREAMVRLVATGLVSVVPQVGTRVELIKLSEVEQARFVRENLEVAAFAAACEAEDRGVARLRVLLAEQESCHARGDLAGFFAADEALHAEIFAISGYPSAWHVMQPMKLQMDRLRWLSLPDRDTVRELIDEHTRIVDALEAGDAEGGKEQIRKHARRVSDHGPRLRDQHPEYFD